MTLGINNQQNCTRDNLITDKESDYGHGGIAHSLFVIFFVGVGGGEIISQHFYIRVWPGKKYLNFRGFLGGWGLSKGDTMIIHTIT